VGENRDRLLTFIEQRGIELVFTENIRPALGRSYGGRIAILPGQSTAEEFSVLVHEVAHLCWVEDYVAYGVLCAIPARFSLFRHNITRFSLQHENLAGTSASRASANQLPKRPRRAISLTFVQLSGYRRAGQWSNRPKALCGGQKLIEAVPRQFQLDFCRQRSSDNLQHRVGRIS
jgi:hypothetical protein